ncbi:unnamed protein product [Mytilus edulis]|uniref:Uncharacterized protein n=1 Tax=Mytilus edulis TaxID=6550 RepID=A0A8S3TL44_MYTED|nr:unnamed protein product [Mytilus edulis]
MSLDKGQDLHVSEGDSDPIQSTSDLQLNDIQSQPKAGKIKPDLSSSSDTLEDRIASLEKKTKVEIITELKGGKAVDTLTKAISKCLKEKQSDKNDGKTVQGGDSAPKREESPLETSKEGSMFKEKIVLYRGQAWFKLQYFAGDRASDISIVVKQEVKFQVSYSVVYERLRYYLSTLGIYEGETPHSFRSGCTVTMALSDSASNVDEVMNHVGWFGKASAEYYGRVNTLIDSEIVASNLAASVSQAENIELQYREKADFSGLKRAF